MERDELVPSRIELKALVWAEHRTPAVGVDKDPYQPSRDLIRHLIEIQLVARPGRAFDPEPWTEVAVVNPERLDEKVVDRHPDRAAPVGVAAEKARARLRRLIHEVCGVAANLKLQRMIAVPPGERANSMLR